MGASQSQQIFNKISRVIPQVHEYRWDEKGNWKDSRPFRNDQDRTQFIHSLMTVMSNNGAMWLEGHDFKLLQSRKPNEEFISTLVAIDTISGRIDAKIEPTEGGKDQVEAFQAFKKYVELRLGEVLETIPDAAGPSVVAASSVTGSSRRTSVTLTPPPPEQPPAYDADRGVLADAGGGKF